MIKIVIVSHSSLIAQGVKQLADEMTRGDVTIIAAGGLNDEEIGTSVDRIYAALQAASNTDGTLVMVDLGSAVMSTQAAIEMLTTDEQTRVRVSNGPLVEGAIVAAVEASIGKTLDEVNTSAEAAAGLSKLG